MNIVYKAEDVVDFRLLRHKIELTAFKEKREIQEVGATVQVNRQCLVATEYHVVHREVSNLLQGLESEFGEDVSEMVREWKENNIGITVGDILDAVFSATPWKDYVPLERKLRALREHSRNYIIKHRFDVRKAITEKNLTGSFLNDRINKLKKRDRILFSVWLGSLTYPVCELGIIFS